MLGLLSPRASRLLSLIVVVAALAGGTSCVKDDKDAGKAAPPAAGGADSGGVVDAAKDTAKAAVDAGKEVVDAAKEAGKEAIDAAKDAGAAAVDAVKDTAKEAADATKETAEAAVESVKDTAAEVAAEISSGPHAGLLDPSQAEETAPDTFRAKLVTTKGDIVFEVHRDWSPNGADRFYNLVKIGFFKDVYFFRVVDGFMAQFGISGDPKVSKAWRSANIMDDPVAQSNQRGFVTFAKTGLPNSRSTQFFINFKNNSFLDGQGFSPFAQVVEGMDVVDQLERKYGERTTQRQGEIQMIGNKFLEDNFPGLDRILSASIVTE